MIDRKKKQELLERLETYGTIPNQNSTNKIDIFKDGTYMGSWLMYIKPKLWQERLTDELSRKIVSKLFEIDARFFCNLAFVDFEEEFLAYLKKTNQMPTRENNARFTDGTPMYIWFFINKEMLLKRKEFNVTTAEIIELCKKLGVSFDKPKKELSPAALYEQRKKQMVRKIKKEGKLPEPEETFSDGTYQLTWINEHIEDFWKTFARSETSANLICAIMRVKLKNGEEISIAPKQKRYKVVKKHSE